MKRILSIFLLLLLITACDDGNLTVDAIDFSEIAAQKCALKDVLYKVKDNEMLYLEIPATTFTENETLDGEPIELQINATNKVTYRRYSDVVSADNICPTVPSGTPSVTEQWQATAGTIQITATAIKTTTASTNATKITGYKYYVVFKDITFQKPTGPQVYSTFIFGNYSTTISSLAFGFDDQVDKSSCDNRIFNFSGSESLVFDPGTNYASLFPNEPATKTALIDATNKLTYRLFNNAVTDAYFCAATTPSTPLLTQQWDAVEGVDGTSGMIEVVTSVYGSGYQHTIHFKKLVLKKGNSTFTLGDDYIFGSFVTNP